jgi:H/ACA ribonucleoprotein complex non-core subunit NAF1
LDSDSESENDGDVLKNTVQFKTVDEDGEEGDVATTVLLRTKNELSEPDILVPPIAQVGPDEQLEKVGEIMNIVNNVVIVKGEASAMHRTLKHTLDSETLLVYEDRKVLGYVSIICFCSC